MFSSSFFTFSFDFTFFGNPLCFVDAKSSKSFSDILLAISFTDLETFDFEVSPLLTERANPIIFCCCVDLDFSCNSVSPTVAVSVVGSKLTLFLSIFPLVDKVFNKELLTRHRSRSLRLACSRRLTARQLAGKRGSNACTPAAVGTMRRPPVLAT